MLVGNFGTSRPDFTLEDDWWINTIADSYYGVMLNNFWNHDYNGTGTDNKILVARKLKARNPKLKVSFYQPADRFGDTVFVQDYVAKHPEMWLR